MNKVFFDLEWNTGFLDGNSFDEIIEIGAVKTDEEYRQIDGFRRLIRPVIYRKMNPYIQKILAITMKDLQGEEPLASVAKAFFAGATTAIPSLRGVGMTLACWKRTWRT